MRAVYVVRSVLKYGLIPFGIQNAIEDDYRCSSLPADSCPDVDLYWVLYSVEHKNIYCVIKLITVAHCYNYTSS